MRWGAVCAAPYSPFLAWSKSGGLCGHSWKGAHCHVACRVGTSVLGVMYRWWVCRREELIASFRRTFLVLVQLNGIPSVQGNERKLVRACSFSTRVLRAEHPPAPPFLYLFSPPPSERKMLKTNQKKKIERKQPAWRVKCEGLPGILELVLLSWPLASQAFCLTHCTFEECVSATFSLSLYYQKN